MAGAFVSGQVDDAEHPNTDLTLTLTGVTAGNLLVVCSSWGNSRTLDGVSSDVDGTFTEAISEETGIWNLCSIWYLENASSGTHVITVDISANGAYTKSAVLEYSGIVTSGALDGTPSSGDDAGAQTINSGNVTTSNTSMFLGTGCHGGGQVELTHNFSGTGETDRWEDETVDYQPICIMDAPAQSSGTYSTTFERASGTTQIACALAAFQEAAAGGANPKGPLGMPFHGPFAGPIGL